MKIDWIKRQGTKLVLRLRSAPFLAYDRFFSHIQRADQYTFVKSRYRGTLLAREGRHELTLSSELPRRVYCFWTGDNPMSVARTACLDSLRSTMINIELILVTPANLDGFIVAGNPLHPAYKYLSLVHKADYLRAYFMHHHGGGYVDIKEINSDWLPAFEQLDENPTKWALGYGETSSQDVAQIGGRLGHDLKKYHRILLGNCAYIFRSNTPFTSEWLAEQERRLDNFLPHLLTNPGGVRNEVPNYPIAWTEILGDIFHPLCLKYSRRLIIDNRIKPNVKSHI